MPSVLFHAAVAGLIASALLGDRLDRRSLAFIMGTVVFIDLDTLVGLALPGAHRSLFHNVFFLAAIAVVLRWEATRKNSLIAKTVGPDAPRVAAVATLAVALAGVAPDLFWNGANLLYPLQDRFYEFSGEMLLSTKHGLVQTIFDLTPVGDTNTLHFTTGVDPSPGAEEPGAERKFLVAGSGLQFLVTATGLLVTWLRLRENART